MAEAEPKSSNRPFFIAFVIGALVLTGLPLLQSRFLKAPPPVMTLDAWAASEQVSASALGGHVVLLQVELSPCDADCVTRVTEFGRLASHVSDLGDKIILVTLADDAAQTALGELAKPASAAWRFAPPEPGVMAQLQRGLVKFLGADSTDFARSHSIALLDQNGAVRGYWQGDLAGRGNVVNAARLLAKKGPNP